jgi:hypothetical protein
VLRSLADPPEVIPGPSDADRRAEAELIRRLTAIANAADRPAPVPQPDRWADARKDLDAFLAKAAAQPRATYPLLELARELAKDDRAKALRVLRAAADAARRSVAPKVEGLPPEFEGITRVGEIIRVAEAAADLGWSAEAKAWLAEAEGMIGGLPASHRDHPLVELAAAWVRLDPAQTERLLPAPGPDPFGTDLAVSRVLDRLLNGDPTAAVPWLARFREPSGAMADPYRGWVAVRLAARDLPHAIRISESVRNPVYRGLTLARLASAAHPTDPGLAHALIGKAMEALATDPDRGGHDSGDRTGAAVYLVWQAEAVGYPDRASVVAVALLARSPVPAVANAAASRRAQAVRLAAGVAGVDPAAARALLGRAPEVLDDDPEGDRIEGLIALALTDPGTVARLLDPDLDSDAAGDVLAILKRRSEIVHRLGFLHRIWWVRDGREGDESDEDR